MTKLLLITPKLKTSGGVSSYWNSLIPILEKKINLQNFQVGGNGKNIFMILKEQYTFRKTIQDKPSLVFLNPSLGFNSFFRDAFFAKQLINKNIPFVVFFHGWSLNFEKKVTNKYQNFFLNSLGKAKKIFVLSKDFKKKLEEWGYKGQIIIETTNIDNTLLKHFNYESKIKNDKFMKPIKILFLARVLIEKGIVELIDAFLKISEKNENIELTIAGSGEILNSLKENYKKYTNIEFLGHIEGSEKIDIFTNSSIYCLPSYSEGLPTSVLEAMAFGLPIITTPVGGLKDFFQDSKMGYFVEVKNSLDIKNKLELLITNKNKILEIGKFNHEFAKKYLLNNIVAERMHSLLEDSINYGDLNVK